MRCRPTFRAAVAAALGALAGGAMACGSSSAPTSPGFTVDSGGPASDDGGGYCIAIRINRIMAGGTKFRTPDTRRSRNERFVVLYGEAKPEVRFWETGIQGIQLVAQRGQGPATVW